MNVSIGGLKLVIALLIIIGLSGCAVPQAEQSKSAIQVDQTATADQSVLQGQYTDANGTIQNPPAITNVRVSKASESAAWITWQTDRPTTYELTYWEQSSEKRYKIIDDSIVDTVHFIKIEPLDEERVYVFTLKATDADVPQISSTYEGVLTIKTGPQVGQAAPDFKLPLIMDSPGDHNVVLSHFRGRVVILVFWDVNCSTCKEKMPILQDQFQRVDNNNFVILAVHIPGQEADVKRFYNNFGLTLPVMLDADGTISKLYEVQRLPASFVINKSGIIIDKNISFETQDELDKLIKGYMMR
jgi:peroxiredoxin